MPRAWYMLLSQLQLKITLDLQPPANCVDLLFVSELSRVLEPVVEEKIDGLLTLSESQL